MTPSSRSPAAGRTPPGTFPHHPPRRGLLQARGPARRALGGFAFVVLAAVFLGACAPGATMPPAPAEGPRPVAPEVVADAAAPERVMASPVPERSLPADWSQEGLASWYGPNFAGRPTANGETFDPSGLTAAHPTLPFGTRVRVTHQRSGRSVVVRINDRGPFKPNRVIDLSRAAAEAIGLVATGVARVRIRPVGVADGPKQMRVDGRLGGYDVIVPGADPGTLVVLTGEAGTSVLVRAVPLQPRPAAAHGGEDVFASPSLVARLGQRATVQVD